VREFNFDLAGKRLVAPAVVRTRADLLPVLEVQLAHVLAFCRQQRDLQGDGVATRLGVLDV